MLRQDRLDEVDYLEAGFVNKEDMNMQAGLVKIRKIIDMFWQDQLNRYLEA